MLDALTLDQVRMFVTVADSGSFRAAAGRVGRAQSAVSFAIANLEAQLGVTLFDRDGYRPRLTPEGRALLADARAILLKVNLMRSRANGLGAGVEMELAMAIDPIFPRAAASHALKGLQDAFPSVAVQIWTAPLGGTYAAICEGRATFAIAVGNLLPEHVALEALGTVAMVAVVAADHPLGLLAGTGGRIGVEELADHVQIVVRDPSALTEGRDFAVMSPVTWRVSDMETKHALLLAGVGWGTMPLWLVADDLDAGRLVRVRATQLGPDAQRPAQAYLARPIDAALGPAAQHLRDRLLGCMAVTGAGQPEPVRAQTRPQLS